MLQRAAERATALAAALEPGAGEELKWWTGALVRNCREHLKDLLFLAPWLTLAPDSAGRVSGMLAQLDRSPTLRQVSELDQSLCPLLEAALHTLALEPASSRKPEEEAGRDDAEVVERLLHRLAPGQQQRLGALQLAFGAGQVNGGLRLYPVRDIQVDFAMMGFRSLGGGASYRRRF